VIQSMLDGSLHICFAPGSLSGENVDCWAEILVDRGVPMILKEFAYALRRLWNAPGFALIAILTLALGIGASTAVFTVLDSVVLKPLTYRDSGQLVAAWERVRFLASEPGGPNPRHFDLWQKRATAFRGLALLRFGASGLATGAGHPQLTGTVISQTNLFDILEVRPLLGRTFTPEESTPGRDKVAILTYTAWQNYFDGNPNVIGKVVRLADVPRQVVGILPPSFHFPNANALRSFRSNQGASSAPEPAVFIPATIDLNGYSWDGEYGNWIALGRLNPGSSIALAELQLNSIEAQILNDVPAYNGDKQPGALSASVQPLQEAVVGDVKASLWFLMAAVAGLILIACVNLANTQIGRAVSRDRDAAVRSALGATRFQLMWSSLAESVLLALAGGCAGFVVAGVVISLFRSHSPVDLPRLAEVDLNPMVFLFALAITLGSILLFGTLPALRFLRADPLAALQKSSGRTLGSRRGRHLRTWLIGLQVFGCTALLLVTGLFTKSLFHLLLEDRGFETGHVVVADVRLPIASYASDQSRDAFIDAVLNKVRIIPGVQSAGFISAMPLEGESWIEGISRPGQSGQQVLANLRWASPGYFETMKEKLIAGRFFEDRDRNVKTAVLSQALAKTLWRDQNSLGGEIEVEGRKFSVIGIVGDTLTSSLKSAPARMVYVHYVDRPPYTAVFTVRGAQTADQLISRVRAAIWECAPDITIARVKTLDSQLSGSLAAERVQTGILVVFAISAVLLAMLGIYAVLSYSVAGRTQEIGVRIALGASRGQMYALTLGEAGIPVLAGLAAGFACGILAARAVHNLLYGVKVLDASVSATVAALFLGAAFAAAFIPARRAASVDPMEALRAE
jgi:predicted permease